MVLELSDLTGDSQQQVILPLRGRLAMTGDIWGCHKYGSAPGISGGEKGSCWHAAVHRKAPKTKNCLVKNVNSANTSIKGVLVL